MKYFLIILSVLLLFAGCREEINVTLPASSKKVVIEGSIENGQFAKVMITRNKPLFSTVTSSSLSDYIIKDANVFVSNGLITDTLKLSVDTTVSIPLLYIGTRIIGTPGQIYYLTIFADGQKFTAVTSIPMPIALDSVWWKPQPAKDSLGFAWGHLTDPEGFGNAYRWEVKGPTKLVTLNGLPFILNRRYVAPDYASFDDKFVDGKSFEFSYDRPYDPAESSYYLDEPRVERGYYKQKDTIYIKFSTMDHISYLFYSTYEQGVNSNGNPFSSPVTILSNINGGGLGVWAGFGVTYDTILPPH